MHKQSVSKLTNRVAFNNPAGDVMNDADFLRSEAHH